MAITSVLAIPSHSNESWQIPRTASARQEEANQCVGEYDRRQQDAKNEEDVECGCHALHSRRKRDIYDSVNSCAAYQISIPSFLPTRIDTLYHHRESFNSPKGL